YAVCHNLLNMTPRSSGERGRCFHDVVCRETKLLHQDRTWRRLPEGGHADDAPVQPYILVPVIAGGCLHSQTLAHCGRQYRFAIGGILGLEDVGRRHGHQPCTDAVGLQTRDRIGTDGHFGAGGYHDQFRRAFAILEDVAAAGDIRYLLLVAVLVHQILTREHQRGRAIAALDGGLPRNCGLHCIARAPHRHVRRHAQVGDLLHRLVGRTVLTLPDGVVGIDEDAVLLHQGSHAHGVAGIFHEHEEGATVGNEAAVQCNAVHDGAHAKLTHTIVDIVAVHPLCDRRTAGPGGEVGATEVGGAAYQLRQMLTEGLEAVLRGLAAGDVVTFFLARAHVGVGDLIKAAGELALEAAHQLHGQI